MAHEEQRKGEIVEGADLEVARFLGSYHDQLVEGLSAEDAARLLETRPDLARELEPELEAMALLEALVELDLTGRKFGDFRIIRELGRGATGIVYEAYQVSLARHVALKILLPGLLVESKALGRFLRGAQLAASISHPNVVGIFAAGVEAGMPYFAMEYAEGETLHELVARLRTVDADPDASAGPLVTGGRADSSRVAEAFAGAAEGLQAIHSRGIIHRDLKPANLITEECGRIRILDFGLARLEGQTSLTMTLERLGTPLYMSPEQASGRQEDLTPRTDIFSLGATLYEVLALKPPFEGRNYQEILWKIIHKDAVFPRRSIPRVPRDLERIVLKCLRKNPSARYGTAEALAQDLRRFVRGDPVEAEDEPVLERLGRRVRRARWTIAKAGAAALAVIILALAGISHSRAQENAKIERSNRYEKKVSDGVFLMLRKRLLSPPQNLLLPVRETVSFPMESAAARAADASIDDLSRVYQAKSFSYRAGPAVTDLEAAVKLAIEELVDAERIAPERPEARYHLAKAFQQLGNSGKALEKLDQAIEAQPGFTPVLALRAAILEYMGHPGASRAADLARGSMENPRRAQAWIDAEKAWLDQDWKKAVEAYDQLSADAKGRDSLLAAFGDNKIRAALVRLKSLERQDLLRALEDIAGCVERWPGRLEPVLLLGKVYHLLGETDEAEATFAKLLASAAEPSRGDATEAIVEAYRDLGDQRRALAWIDRMDPKLEMFLVRSEVLSSLKDHVAAVTAARGALERAPQSQAALLALANALLAGGESAEARKVYGEAAALDPGNPRPVLGRSACLESDGDLEGARRVLEEALSRGPESGEIHYNLGRLLAMLGREDEAMGHYRQVSELEPVAALAHLNVGAILDGRGQGRKALEEYERATELSPRLAIARYNLGWAYQRERSFAEAEVQYREAIGQGLHEPSVYVRQGVCLQQLGRFDAAIKAYEEAIRLDRKNPEAHHAKGICHYWMGNFSLAADEYRRTLELDPDKGVRVLNELGDALEKTGAPELAASSWRKAVDREPKFIWAHNSLARLILQGRCRPPGGEDLEEAIIRLEDAAVLHHASSGLRTLLEQHRESLAPRLVSFASVDAKLPEPEALVEGGSAWRFRRGTSEPSEGLEWTRLGFEDSRWEEGKAAFGTPEAPGVGTPLPDMEGGYTSIYLRRRFEVADPSRVQAILLRVRCDAGYVAYLNGKEVFRASAGGSEVPRGFSATADLIEDYDFLENGFWTRDEVHLEPEALLPGENVLALHGLRFALQDGLDFRIDASLAARPVFDDLARRKAEEALEAFRANAAGAGDATRIEYFEARLLQMAGDPVTALKTFHRIRSQEPGRPEPVLRSAECMAAAGNRQAAAEALRAAISAEPRLAEHDTLWDAWLALQVSPAEEILEGLPDLPPERPDDTIQHPMQIEWLLRELSSERRAVRINCGGAGHVSSDGKFWGRDRFFRSGQEWYLSPLERPLPDGALHRTERFFPRYRRPVEGYGFPLPNGRYRLSLHFTEGWFKERGQRIFDVLVQGKVFLDAYEPVHAVPDTRVLDPVEVKDGYLRIDFIRRVQNPKISAIEIERKDR